MKLIKMDQIPKQLSTNPIFTGGTVALQPLVTQEMAKFFSIINVHFTPGARTKLHTHTCDQVLIVTGGKGIVKTEKEELFMEIGDVIYIPAGEKHYHGATKNSEFSHISVLSADSKETILEN